MFVKKIAAGAAMAGALGFSAVGLGAGVASAAPSAPVVVGTQWQQDRGDWDHWGHGDGRGWGDRGDWGYGGYGPGWGCVTGPFGHITWCP
jgi:hypothetical protein